MTVAQESVDVAPKSLFQRLGGVEGITLIVDDVIEAHMNNPEIKEIFLPYKEQPERLASIRQHTIDFLVLVVVDRLNIRDVICHQHIQA